MGLKTGLTPRRSLVLLGTLGFVPSAIAIGRINDSHIMFSIVVSSLISMIGFFVTKATIPLIKARTLRAGLYGKDINKKGSKEGEKNIPESLGLAPGVVFLVSCRLDV